MKEIKNEILYKISFDIKNHNITIISPFVMFENKNILLVDITDDNIYEIPFNDISNLKIKTM